MVRVEELKRLGVILDSKLSFASHTQTAITKSRQGTGYDQTPLQALATSHVK